MGGSISWWFQHHHCSIKAPEHLGYSGEWDQSLEWACSHQPSLSSRKMFDFLRNCLFPEASIRRCCRLQSAGLHQHSCFCLDFRWPTSSSTKHSPQPWNFTLAETPLCFFWISEMLQEPFQLMMCQLFSFTLKKLMWKAYSNSLLVIGWWLSSVSLDFYP